MWRHGMLLYMNVCLVDVHCHDPDPDALVAKVKHCLISMLLCTDAIAVMLC